MSFDFHASPPPGEWMNDPNGLAFQNGRYRLWAQHSEAAPGFREIGWGSWSSSDLLHWRWDGVAIPYNEGCSVYSGSIAATETGLVDAWFTRHDHSGNWQTQIHAVGPDWTQTSAKLPPEGRNCRDPFVFFSAATQDWVMLVAEPCDWNDWASEAASHLTVWRSTNRRSWLKKGTIGPWHPPGVMWEVPALIEFGDVQALIVSLVDRRGGGRDAGVVEEHVKLRDFCKRRRNAVLVAHVARQDPGRVPRGGLDQGSFAAAHKRDLPTGGDKGARAGATDPGPCSGNDNGGAHATSSRK